MQQLTGLDASFLALETPGVYGHVGSVCILDAANAPAPVTLESLTRLLESRLHKVLHGWLLVHIPLCYAVLLLGAVHAVVALKF